MLQIFNLFSAFGNISKIIYMRSKSSALIEYDNCTHSCLAKDFMGDHIFNGSLIKIFYSHHDVIFFKSPEEKPEDEDYFEPSEKMNRFKANTPASVNPPIDTLHLSNLRRESCSYDAIKMLFEPFSKVK